MKFQSLGRPGLGALLTTCVFILVAGYAQATTYYVATTGNDSNAGTQAAPFATVSVGVAAAHAGDTVIVENGTYGNEGQLANLNSIGAVVTMTNSGTASSPITIMAQNRGGAILNSASTTIGPLGCYGAWSYFDLSYTAYVVIQGFVLENSCVNGIRANGTAHDITLRWNTFEYIGNWNNPATTLSPSGIYIASTEYNFTLDGNVFHDIGGGTNINQQHAIYTKSSNLKVINNIFYNQVHGWDVMTAGGNGIYVANNTFAFANPNREGQVLVWDGGTTDSLQNVVIENNVFYQPNGYGIIATLDGGGSIGGCNIEYNLTTVGTLFDNGAVSGQSISCNESSNLTNTNPNFVNATSSPYDFHLVAGSPAIDSGLNNTMTVVDNDNWPRPVNVVYDRGAYEYHSGSGTNPTISLSSNPSSVSILEGGSGTSSITATVTGSASPQFSVSGLPSGVTGTFSPSSCSGSCTTTLTINSPSTYQGSATLTITATSGSVSGSATVKLTVSSGGGGGSTIAVSANPGSVSMAEGGSGSSAVSATVTGSVDPAFSISGLPSGVTGTFSPASCTGSCATTLNLSSTGTFTGSATLTITASSGSVSGSTTITLDVTTAIHKKHAH